MRDVEAETLAARKKRRQARKKEKQIGHIAHDRPRGSISPSTDMEDMTFGGFMALVSVGELSHHADVEANSSALAQEQDSCDGAPCACGASRASCGGGELAAVSLSPIALAERRVGGSS